MIHDVSGWNQPENEHGIIGITTTIKLYVYGNPITAIAGYQGIATEELTPEELDAFHPDYPVATCMVAQK